MGKWAARLAEKTAAPPFAGTDETDKRGVLSVLAVTPERGAADFHVLPGRAAHCREVHSPGFLDLASVAWTDADIARFIDRRDRLVRWGWAEPDAEELAERLVKCDREQDDRVSCTDCQHYRPGRCNNHRRANLQSADVGRDLAAMLQRCPGFSTFKMTT